MDEILKINQARENNIVKGFYLDTAENRKKGRVGRGYDMDSGVTLTPKELYEKFGKPEAKLSTGVKFSVKTGDPVFFEKDGKRFIGRITRYPSNDKIEINYGSVVIHKDEIVGANGKLFEGIESKEVNELAPLGQESISNDERALRASEKAKLSKEIEAFKEVLKQRALRNVSSSIGELETYQNKLKRWKQLGGGSTSLYGFVSTKEAGTDEAVENAEEVDKTRRFAARKLISLVDKVKDILAENFDVDTVTAFRNDFMKSSLYKKAIGGGTKIDDAKIIDVFEQYTSSFFTPRGITSIF